MQKRIHIPTPCHEQWDKMTNVPGGRHCDVCTKVVKDFTRSTNEEILEYMASGNGEEICGRVNTAALDALPASVYRLNGWGRWWYGLLTFLVLLGFRVDSLWAQNEQLPGSEPGKTKQVRSNAKYHINGKIKTVSGRKLERGRVTVRNEGRVLAAVKLDDAGRFRFLIDGSGFPDKHLTIDVEADEIHYSTDKLYIGKMDPDFLVVIDDTIIHRGELVQGDMMLENSIMCYGFTVLGGLSEDIIYVNDYGKEAIDINDDFDMAVGKGIDDLVSWKMNIYPNPSDGDFKISLGEQQITEIVILDMQGKVVTMIAVNGRTMVDVSLQVASGIYLVNAYHDNDLRASEKIIIR